MRCLDTAFASKVAYFACFDRENERGPLIADLNTAWALWALDGTWNSRKSATLYAQYVEWAQRWASHVALPTGRRGAVAFQLRPRYPAGVEASPGRLSLAMGTSVRLHGEAVSVRVWTGRGRRSLKRSSSRAAGRVSR